jgi:hypothetical protein
LTVTPTDGAKMVRMYIEKIAFVSNWNYFSAKIRSIIVNYAFDEPDVKAKYKNFILASTDINWIGCADHSRRCFARALSY